MKKENKMCKKQSKSAAKVLRNILIEEKLINLVLIDDHFPCAQSNKPTSTDVNKSLICNLQGHFVFQ